MNRIFYFSGSGKTKRLAEFFEKKLGIAAENIIETKEFDCKKINVKNFDEMNDFKL